MARRTNISESASDLGKFYGLGDNRQNLPVA